MFLVSLYIKNRKFFPEISKQKMQLENVKHKKFNTLEFQVMSKDYTPTTFSFAFAGFKITSATQSLYAPPLL